MEDPTVKKIQEIASDEKVQKAVKEGFETASKLGEKIGKKFMDGGIGKAAANLFKPKNKNV
jgi:hypothetical protein